MRRKSIVIILILMMILSSCVKLNNNTLSKESNDKIQLWYYYVNGAGYYTEAILKIVAKAKDFCNENNIPLEVVEFREDNISRDDYILKRNVAAATGNMIIIEDARFIQDIAEKHADYSKLSSYNILISSYKDRFCIPLGIGYMVLNIENQAMEYYDINMQEKPVITYNDYLVIKQDMKDKGAKFELNNREFYEMIDYHLNMNRILYINDESEILKNRNKLKEILKKAILDICNDIILFNDGKIDENNRIDEKLDQDYSIYDENSKLTLKEKYPWMATQLLTLQDYRGVSNIDKKTFFIDIDWTFFSPCFYMYKKITNDKIYDLANHIVDESTFSKVYDGFFSPVFDTEKTRVVLSVDDNWQIAKTDNKRIKIIIDSALDLLIKNKDKSKLIADSYFGNERYKDLIIELVVGTVYDVAQKLSNDVSGNLSLKNFNNEDKEINKIIDDKLDEFINNFYVHNN